MGDKELVLGYSEINTSLLKFEKKIKVTGVLGDISKTLGGSDIIFGNDLVLIKSRVSYNYFLSVLLSMIGGVSTGYFVEIQFVGLGYKFINLNGVLLFKLGFTHYIKYVVSKSVNVIGYKNRILIFGLDLQEVMLIASAIRSFKVPDIYKGKGIGFLDEVVLLKVGKQR